MLPRISGKGLESPVKFTSPRPKGWCSSVASSESNYLIIVVAVRGVTVDDDLAVLFSSAHQSRQTSQSCTTLCLLALALVRVLGLPLPLVRICEKFTGHCLAPWYLILRFTEIFPHPESLAAQAAYTEPFLPGSGLGPSCPGMGVSPRACSRHLPLETTRNPPPKIQNSFLQLPGRSAPI